MLGSVGDLHQALDLYEKAVAYMTRDDPDRGLYLVTTDTCKVRNSWSRPTSTC